MDQRKGIGKTDLFFQLAKILGWVAVDGGEYLGCCAGNIEPYFTGDYFYLKEMFVYPQKQRKGVGSQLMKTIKAHLDSIGIKTIILFTSNEGFPFAFWQKQGFGEMTGMRMMGFDESK